MKKTFYLFLLAAAPIVFNSCNSDDEEDNFVLKETKMINKFLIVESFIMGLKKNQKGEKYVY